MSNSNSNTCLVGISPYMLDATLAGIVKLISSTIGIIALQFGISSINHLPNTRLLPLRLDLLGLHHTRVHYRISRQRNTFLLVVGISQLDYLDIVQQRFLPKWVS